MHYALSGHSRLDKLVVVDMSPTNANLSSEFGLYITAMRKVEDAKVTSKDEANKILSETVDSLSVRQFILTNLRKLPGESTMSFRINVPALESSLDSLWTFPHEGSGKTREGPTLFIGGKKARYITASKEPLIRKFFPNATIEYLDAGHWVHSEKPEEFVSLVTSFLKS
ncbi:hypothetical protein PhCBS80983_g04261 [Powellomyces hirtus]|uniref:AB hydrolase-1 domain-containing protein n=1 Tax=Powellomyces hirtus TaxID=109895 RepID=A0A507DYV4_9FUNG|nr:hypothetical protein PhCBS80983_g04261 [Powellomyces hirtus]